MGSSATTRDSTWTYWAPESGQPPDWQSVRGVASVRGPRQRERTTRYLDTADLRLRAAGVTLRQRGDDWRITVGGRRHRVAASSELLRGIARDAELIEVAVLTATRTSWTLLDEAGADLAEVTADQITASVPQRVGDDPAAATVRAWRQLEITLAPGVRPKLAPRLARAAGLTEPATSKLGTALNLPAPAEPDTSTAGGVLTAYLADQIRRVHHQDIAIRGGMPDAVHRMRVACRKIRATLRTFRPVFDQDQVAALRADLRWFGGVLAAARDTEVRQARLRDEVADLPVEHVLGPVAAAMTARFARDETTAAAAVAEAMTSPRYFQLLDRLDRLRCAPPLRDKASGDPKRVLRKSVRKTWRRALRSASAAQRLAPGPERDAALHRVRKDVKNARYAADAVHPAFGGRLRHWRARCKAVQDVLGEHRDSVLTGGLLRQWAIQHDASAGGNYTYGYLSARQAQRARQAEQSFAAEWSTRRHGIPRWLH